jgi:hypothetical protein
MLINEVITTPTRLPWLPIAGVRIGWWLDAKVLRMYHGSNLDHVKSFAEHGLNRPDPRTGMFSLAYEPYTARAYAVMGGEAHFLAAKSKALSVPENKRVVIVFDIPHQWILQHGDFDFYGNDPEHKARLKDKSLYEQWARGDQQYYQLCELRVKTPVPPTYMAGYMLKNV